MQNKQKQNNDYQIIPLDDWSNYFYTTDFDLSVTLLCKNYILETIDAESSGKATFVFQNDKNIVSDVDNYWQDRVMVSPLNFATVRKNLKSRIYGMRKQF